MRTAFRHILPARRHAETFNMTFGGQNQPFAITCGYYDDEGKDLGEVFIDGPKEGSEMRSITHDSAVLVSIALQYGVPLATMRDALSRDKNGAPLTIIGAVLDKIIKQRGEPQT